MSKVEQCLVDYPVSRVDGPSCSRKILKKRKLHLAKGIPPDNCQDRQCNPLLLTVHEPHVYGLSADVIKVDPVGRFSLNLIEGKTSPIVATPNSERNNKPELPHNDPRLVTVIEIKDLKQTLEIEIGYGDTNA